MKDGDTIDVLKGTETITVRLEGIDAPEKGQEHGAKAGEALAGWIKGKDVRIGVTGRDQYGRTLGVVYLADVDINSRLLS